MNILRHTTAPIVRTFKKYSVTTVHYTVDDKNKDIVISETTARAIKGEAELAFLGEEFTWTEEIKSVICDGGATSALSSLFENCTDCQPKIVASEIKTAEGEVVMATTHVCMKTYYVKVRTAEIRPIVCKAYIVKSQDTELFVMQILKNQDFFRYSMGK
jgi:hypothetical protein